MAKLLYFASVREAMGRGAEELPLPATVTDVASLRRHLGQLGAPYAEALTAPHLHVAVNQAHARDADPVGQSDEIAFFPPVSGG
ncbi:molybdopterin converting factor subunit 1 [Magnetofaba australis]|uniref:Putative molybdopterin converting factor subunit 1 n=1 Tax=Magnetofaba australis IT-1 TaxID=1434232 RepID=A0A1Y2K1H6_9PROT|nr:molybdopterin converting factor subunit 1 [Magnetofaba australis]OSM01832.1 putative molybdopterin converting factor subunit 1 [Magnetofaba australis IT-1]